MFPGVCLGLLLSLGGFPALAATTGDPLGATRTLVEQWVQSRQLTSQTRADWERDKELLLQTRALYERELHSLEDRSSRLSTNTTQVDRDLASVREEVQSSDAALSRARELVAGLEERARGLLVLLPSPLRRDADSLIRRLPTAGSETHKATAAERLQTVVALLNEIDKFNASVTVVSEVQKNPEGAEVQVETAYLGLAQAWFVDKAGSYAGVGIPGSDGWKWEPRPELAGPVRRAISAYRETAPPAFVALPFTSRR